MEPGAFREACLLVARNPGLPAWSAVIHLGAEQARQEAGNGKQRLRGVNTLSNRKQSSTLKKRETKPSRRY